MQEIRINGTSAGQRLNKFLGKYLDLAPQSFIYKMLRKKNIKWNGKKADGSELLAEGDLVRIYMTDETIAHFRKDGRVPELETGKDAARGKEAPASDKASGPGAGMPVPEEVTCLSGEMPASSCLHGIDILYEDQDILILNKPSGILSQKTAPEDETVNEWIVSYYREKSFSDPLFTPSVCNRLDRNTSGVLLAGLSLQGSRQLSAMLKNRILHKYYLTIVSGRVKQAETVEGFLVKKASRNQVMIFKTREEALQARIVQPFYIKTRYEPLAYGRLKDMDFTLLKVELLTGKTHQIRAHLSAEGYPIIGDGKYGRKSVNAVMKQYFGLRCQLLHAHEVVFPECDLFPDGMTIQAAPPEIFERIREKIFSQP